MDREDIDELSRLSRGNSLDMLMAAQELRDRLGPRRFKDLMEHTFRSADLRPTECHRLITSLPFSTVLTTNYDKLIEMAYASANVMPPRMLTHQNIPALASLLGTEAYTLKIHGDIDDIESLVFGLGDYRKLSHANVPCRTVLEQLFRDRTVLFVGYSLNDPDLTLLLDAVRTTYHGYSRTHYALLSTEQVGAVARRRFDRDFGIHVIPYSPSDATHPEVLRFLQDVRKCVESYRLPRIAIATDNPVRVGILHSSSGFMAMSEEPLVDAAKMAIDEINQNGGLLGQIVLPIVEDGASDSDTFAKKARKLLAEDRVCSLFGCWSSADRKRVVAVLEEVGGLLWYPLQYEGGEQSPHVIYTGATPNQQILPAVDWCLKHGWRRVFLVGSDYVFPKEAHRIIKSHLTAHGGECVGEKYLDLEDWDVSRVLGAITKAEPHVILNTLNGDVNIPFFRGLARRNRRAPMPPVVSFSIGEVELRRIGTKHTAGHYCAWNYFMSIETPENRIFVNEFKRRFGSERVTDDPIEAAYLQVHVFAAAVRAAGNTRWQDIRAKARGLSYAAPGGPVTIDPESQHVWSEARIGRIREDGQFAIVWRSDGMIPPEPYKYSRDNLTR